MSEQFAYAVMRVDSDGCGFDIDYPIESVFLNKITAETYVMKRVEELIEEGTLDEGTEDDDVFTVQKVPLITVEPWEV